MKAEWKDIDNALPAEGKLVLCIQDMTGICLRERRGEDWYDENEIFDDSELDILYWHDLPEHP